MDGVQLPRGYRTTTKRDFTFYHEVTIDRRFPKTVAVNYLSILTY